MYPLLAILFLLPLSSWADECLENWVNTDNMIEELKTEVYCANTSLAECLNYITGDPFPPIDLGQIVVQETHCYDPTFIIPTSSVPVAIHLADEVIALRDRMLGRVTYREFVNSVEDFYHHTQLHRQRVTRLAMAAYDNYPHLFEGIDRTTMREAIRAHDTAKVLSTVQDSAGRPFYRALYENGYGQYVPRDYAAELNKFDEHFMEKRLRELGLGIHDTMDNATKQQIKLKRDRISDLEKLVDLIDRIYSKVSPEEFGRKMYPLGENFNNPYYQQIVNFLEKNYRNITRDLDYKPLTKLQRTKIAAKLRAGELYASITFRGNKTLAANALRSLIFMPVRKVVRGLSFLAEATRLARILPMVDAPLLFFAEMDRLGCSELGMHSWTKEDGACVPAPGLSEEFLNFLDLSPSDQRLVLWGIPRQCQVLKETHAIHTTAKFSNVTCEDKAIKMRLSNGQGVLFLRLQNGKPYQLNFSQAKKIISNSKRPHRSRIHIDDQLRFTRWCVGKHNLCYDLQNPDDISDTRAEKALKAAQSLTLPMAQAIKKCSSP